MAVHDIPNPDQLRKKYPGNSFTAKQSIGNDIPNSNSKKDRPKIEQVAQVKKVRKQSMMRRLGKSIIEDSIESVKEQAFNDVLVPGIKSLLFEALDGMLYGMIFGKNGNVPTRNYQSRPSYNRPGYGYTNYSAYSNQHNRNGAPRRASATEYGGYSMEPDDIIVSTRMEANRALNAVDDYIREYGQASVATLYDSVGITSDWTDAQYGWTSIRGAQIRHVRDGYLIVMPPTHELD